MHLRNDSEWYCSSLITRARRHGTDRAGEKYTCGSGVLRLVDMVEVITTLDEDIIHVLYERVQ